MFAASLELPPVHDLSFLASMVVAFCVGFACWVLFRAADGTQGTVSRAEREHRAELAKNSWTYRYFGLLVSGLAATPFIAWCARKLKIGLAISRLGGRYKSAPWKPQEFFAATLFNAPIATVLVAWLASKAGWSTTTVAVTSSLTALMIPVIEIRRLKRLAQERVDEICRRLPYAIELMATMIDAGADQREAMQTFVRRSGDHPLTDEFQVLLDAVESGISRPVALEDFRTRLQADEIDRFVFAVNRGREMGVPVAETFRKLASHARVKRTQRAERNASVAENKINGPCLMVMTACLIIVAGPFAYNAFKMLSSLT